VPTNRNPSPAMKIVGARIAEARHKKGISQEDAAVLADMHVTSYGVLERGFGNPSLLTLVRIAYALGVDPGALITGLSKKDIPGAEHMLTASEFVEERKRRSQRR
jgi:transcriptional regulator with XRE-family HTH domain